MNCPKCEAAPIESRCPSWACGSFDNDKFVQSDACLAVVFHRRIAVLEHEVKWLTQTKKNVERINKSLRKQLEDSWRANHRLRREITGEDE